MTKFKRVDLSERMMIQRGLYDGSSLSAIAKVIGRSVSPVEK